MNLLQFTMFGRGLVRGLFLALALVVVTFPAVSQAAVSTPANLTIVGGKYTNDTTPTFTWSAPSGATWYEVRIDGGSYIGLSNVLAYTASTLANGWHNFTVRAHDNSGAVSSESLITFEIDTIGPVVPAVTPSAADEDEPVTFTVAPSGEAWTSSCTLYVSGSSVGTMTSTAAGTFTKTYTFVNDGNYSVHATCVDGDGNTTVGTARTVYVDNDDVIYDWVAEEGDLIKLSCSTYPSVNDPCKAVYYWGEDGKRHPFPNEAVFYSWYSDFNDVIEVSSSTMSSIAMGENVTIKPGTSVVKFATSSAVYAVAEGGILRHYLTPSLVISDYGSDWSSRDLVVISDVFFSNYTIGSVIDSSSDYDPSSAEAGVTSIDDNF